MERTSSSTVAESPGPVDAPPTSVAGVATLTPIDRSSAEPLHVSVFNAIRQAIIDGKLVPGQRYFENDVATRFGVSRTPVREALRSLAAQGTVLFTEGRRGFVVVDPIEDVAVVYEVRQRLEGLAALLAAQHITVPELQALDSILDEMLAIIETGDTASQIDRIADLNDAFHNGVNAASGSSRLIGLIEQLEPIYISRQIVTLYSTEKLRQSHQSHRDILQALWARDGELAEKLTHQHLKQGQQFVLGSPEHFAPRNLP